MTGPGAARRRPRPGEVKGTRMTQPRVYVICSPVTVKSTAWPWLVDELGARVKGAELVYPGDEFADWEDYWARRDEAFAQMAGAVVVPRKHNHTGNYTLGSIGRSEVWRFEEQRKPVLVLMTGDTGTGLLAWEDVKRYRRPGKKPYELYPRRRPAPGTGGRKHARRDTPA